MNDSLTTQGLAVTRFNNAEQMDEIIQQNELLMKENDYLSSFLARLEEEEKNLEDDVQESLLTPNQKLIIAMFETQQLDKEKEHLQHQLIFTQVKEHALVTAAEQKLALLNRLLFQFQREVLGDQQVSNQFMQTKNGVEQIIHKMPKQVYASAIQQFYDKQIQLMKLNIEQFTTQFNMVQQQMQTQAQTRAAAKNKEGGLSQIDFEQLEIENNKLQDKVATRNQEMLRVKLSAGNCMKNLNKIKVDLNQVVERKRKYDEDVKEKQKKISEIEKNIIKTKKELEQDEKTLSALRTKEIFAHDGPQGIDYLSLKVMQNTLERAVSDIERKIAIKQREIDNMRIK